MTRVSVVLSEMLGTRRSKEQWIDCIGIKPDIFQDDFGSYKYGYSNPQSAKQETGSAETEVRGRYRYLDGNGLNRIVEYIADRHGFHVKLDGAPVSDKKYFA